MNKLTELAKTLRKNSTPQERLLWKILRNSNINNLKFRRQYPIGNYIVDFICKEKLLIIEIDGGQHNDDNHRQYDIERTKYLTSRGFRVLRFWNSDINNNISGVYKEILKWIK